MSISKFSGLALTALKSNVTSLSRPYKLNYAITMGCQSRCLTCVKPDEIIIGDNKRIAEIRVGNQATGSKGLNTVSEVFSRNYSGKILRIKALGLLPVEVTPEHPLLVTKSKTKRHYESKGEKYRRTYDFEKPDWKEAKDTTPKLSFIDGDYLCTPITKRTLEVKELNLKQFIKGRGEAISKAKGYSLVFPLNNETAWLLGIYVAEGCPASNGARFSFNSKETHLHKKVKQIAETLGYSVSNTQRRNCTTCCLSSLVLSRALVEWCGKGAQNKKIPDFVLFNKNDSILKSFLKGWEEGDGYWKNKFFYGSTVSKTLALQIQLAYASLRIFAKVSYVHKTRGLFYDRQVNYHDQYRISYSKGKLRYGKQFDNYFLHPIRKIENFEYNGTVHNIGTTDNTYLVSNAVVHNCNIWEIKPKDELRMEEIEQFAKKNNYFRWIELTGGEPFLRSDIVQIAKTFKDKSKSLYILTMPTNSLCNQDTELSRLREILNLGIPRVVITLSLDGHRELHDKIRGIPGNYDKVISMHKRLTELKKEYKNLYFLFGYTMSKFNEGQFRTTYEAVKKEIPTLTYNDFHVNLSQTSSNYYHNQQSEIKTDNSAAILEIADIIKNRRFDTDPIQVIQNAFMKGLLKFAKTGKTPIKCRSLEASIFMDSWGNVYPSIMWDRKIANIRDIGYDLDGVWGSEEAKEVKRLIAEGKDPQQWTSCEAYQSITGRISSLIM